MSLERVLVHCVWVLNGRARILTAGVALVAITTGGRCLGDPKFLPSCVQCSAAATKQLCVLGVSDCRASDTFHNSQQTKKTRVHKGAPCPHQRGTSRLVQAAVQREGQLRAAL